jgi:hypothetical protein
MGALLTGTIIFAVLGVVLIFAIMAYVGSQTPVNSEKSENRW